MSFTMHQVRPLILASLLLGLASSPVAADAYYRWIGDDGVTHYGSRPPEGVQAEKVDTYGKGKPANARKNNASAPSEQQSAAGSQADEQRQIVAQRKQQCDEEKARLKSLQTPGTRLKMKQDDGSSRFLSAEEVAKEISSSKEFINQACN